MIIKVQLKAKKDEKTKNKQSFSFEKFFPELRTVSMQNAMRKTMIGGTFSVYQVLQAFV